MEHRYDNLIAAESSAALQYNRENDMLAKKTIVVLKDTDNLRERVSHLRQTELLLHGEITSHDSRLSKAEFTECRDLSGLGGDRTGEVRRGLEVRAQRVFAGVSECARLAPN